jgi:hypothetical protein
MMATENALAPLQPAVYIGFFAKYAILIERVRRWFMGCNGQKSRSALNQNPTELNQDWSQPDKYGMVGALGDHPAIREIR